MRKTNPTKNRILAVSARPGLYVLTVVLLLLGCSCKGWKQEKERQAVLGVESVPDVTLSASPADALVAWARKGGKTAGTLVHFGSRSGLAYLAPGKAGELKTLLKEKKLGELEQRRGTGPQGLFTSDNYITAAVRLGLVDEVYWVIPFKYAQYFNAELLIKKMLTDSGTPFLNADVEAMKFDNGCVSGRLLGVRTHICSPETFPSVHGQVMVDMDVEFITDFAAERRQSPLRGIKEFFDEIKKRRIPVSGVVVALPENSLSRLAVRRYLGAQMAEALGDSKLLELPTPPELWSARNDADSLFSEGRFAELIKFLKGRLKKFPDDPALLAYEGVALALLGRTDAAAEGLGGLCGKSSGECAVLLFAAETLEAREKPAAAEVYIKKALEIRPGWPDALWALGDLHFRQQRYGKALEAYEGYSRRRDSFVLRLRLGDCLFFLDRKREAADQYARGIDLVDDMTGTHVISRNWESLNRCLTLFREQGSADLVEKASRVLERG